MNRIFLLIVFFLLVVGATGQPLVVTTSGGPSFHSSVFSLTEAGKNFKSRAVSQTKGYLDVTSTNYWYNYYSNYRWRISVYRYDVIWAQELSLQIKRVSNGTRVSNSGSISGGKSWISVSNIPQYFFKGSGAWSNIKLNFRLQNVSVLIPADDYQTTLVFTIYED